MTKTIVIGEKIESPKKKIEFFRSVGSNGAVYQASQKPASFNYLELIKKDTISDIIFAYDDPEHRDSGVLYLGRWNDGIV